MMLLGLIPKVKMSTVNSVFGHRSVLQVVKYNCIVLLSVACMELSVRFHPHFQVGGKKFKLTDLIET